MKMKISSVVLVLFFASCVTVIAAVYNEAEIYFSFDGADGSTTNAAAWQNVGTKGIENAFAMGSNAGIPTPTVSSTIAIRGQAYDNSGAVASALANALQYGSMSTSIEQETERALYNVWSFTWCGWVKQGVDGTPQGRLFVGDSTLEMNYRGSRVEYRIAPGTEGTSFRPAYFSENSIEAGTNWVFLAVVYDGTVTNGDANTFIYAGDEDEAVGLIDSSTNNFGRLDRDFENGASFFLGNSFGLEEDRPFDGYMDEIRIFGDGTQGPVIESESDDSALTSKQLEEIRRYDLGIAVYDLARIHFDFEGVAGTTTNASAWVNNGTVGPENAFAIGENGVYPFSTVSSNISIKGRAYDNSGATASSNANGLQYGSASTSIDQETERTLYNVWSYTWCGWVKQSPEGTPQGRLIYGASSLELNYRGSWVEYRVSPGKYVGDFNRAYFSANSVEAGTNWVFLAVVYDGTITDGSANTFVYAGDEDKAVGLIGSATNNFGRLDRDSALGASFILGNNGLEGSRPFVGYMDEVRIFGEGTQDVAVESGYNFSALSESELETIRQFDLSTDLVGYEGWLADYPTLGTATNKTDDLDSDGVNNLYEYGLGGNPVDGSDVGAECIFEFADGIFFYSHVQRNDDESLVYSLETTDDLVLGTWSNAGYSVVATNVGVGLFDTVTNSIQATGSRKFIRLIIE